MGDGCRLNRRAYEGLIAEDLAWLESVPRTLERDHVIAIVKASADHEYREEPAPGARQAVGWFACWMEAKLAANDHKGHWSTCGFGYLSTRLHQEAKELSRALQAFRPADDVSRASAARSIVQEAADVANFAMMIADNARQWLVAEDPEEARMSGEPDPRPATPLYEEGTVMRQKSTGWLRVVTADGGLRRVTAGMIDVIEGECVQWDAWEPAHPELASIVEEVERLRQAGTTLAAFACEAPGRLPERIQAAVRTFTPDSDRGNHG